MAKPKKNTITSTAPNEDTVNVDIDENGEEDEPAPKQLKKEEAAALLALYIDADNKVTKLEEDVDSAKKHRSDVVKQIHDGLGKGPFQYKDTYLGKIVARDGNYFFRGRGDTTLQSFE